MDKHVTGQCLCSATQFEVELPNHHVHSCHCSMCRRQSSGVIMTIDVVPESLKFTQQDQLGVYDSSAWGERGFCKNCGTILFWRSKDQSFCTINVFALQQLPQDLDFNLEVYIDHKPDFYSFAGQRKSMTEAEIVAMFQPAQD